MPNSSEVVDCFDSLFYVVQRFEDGNRQCRGYVVVPKIGDVPEILAYDDDAYFSYDAMPSHIRSWFQTYSEMQAVSMAHIKEWMACSNQGNEDVSPLLDGILWGQDDPYNSFCPEVEGEKCPTGCVATALAQIMNYHKWPERGNGYIKYNTETYRFGIECDLDNRAFDWGMMKDVYGLSDIVLDDGLSIVSGNNYTLTEICLDELYSVAQCQLKVGKMYSNNSSYFDGDFAIIIADDAGNFIQQSSPVIHISRSIGKVVFYSQKIPLIVPSYLSDGTYRLFCALRRQGTDVWEIADVDNRSLAENNFILIEKEGGDFYIDDRKYPCGSSDYERASVAWLMEAVGGAVRMDYDPEGSGANNYDALSGMRDHLKYDRDMFVANASNYTDELWHKMLQKELCEGRPVYYTGSDGGGGHAFVIDGMQMSDSVVYYHVNWGWDGLCNGYYLLNMLRPAMSGTGGNGNGDYSNGAGMIVGIRPEDGIDNLRITSKGLTLSATSLFPGQNLYVRILSLNTNHDFYGKLQLELQCLDSLRPTVAAIYEVENLSISNDQKWGEHLACCTLPDTLPSGNYKLNIVCTDVEKGEVEVDLGVQSSLQIEALEDWDGGNLSSTYQYVGLNGLQTLVPEVSKSRILLDIESVLNVLPKRISGKLSLLICNEQGGLLTPMNERQTLIIGGGLQVADYQIGGTFSQEMPDGRYQLSLGFLPTDGDKWTFAYEIASDSTLWNSSLKRWMVPFEVVAGNVYFTDFVISGVEGIPWVTNIKGIHSGKCDDDIFYDIFGREVHTLRENCIYITNNGKIFIKQKK